VITFEGSGDLYQLSGDSSHYESIVKVWHSIPATSKVKHPKCYTPLLMWLLIPR